MSDTKRYFVPLIPFYNTLIKLFKQIEPLLLLLLCKSRQSMVHQWSLVEESTYSKSKWIDPHSNYNTKSGTGWNIYILRHLRGDGYIYYHEKIIESYWYSCNLLYVIYDRNVYLASPNVQGSTPLLRIGSDFLYWYCQHTGGQYCEPERDNHQDDPRWLINSCLMEENKGL